MGLDLALDKNIKCLKVIGDFDLIVSERKKSFMLIMRDWGDIEI
jgi:hypothetical protein